MRVVNLAVVFLAMFILACACGGSPAPALPTPVSPPAASPPVTAPAAVAPPVPTAYDALRATAQPWSFGSENEVAVSKNVGCTAQEQAAISGAKVSSGKVYFEHAYFNAESGSPSANQIERRAGTRKVTFTGGGTSVVFNGTKFASGGAICDPECCDSRGSSCEPFDQGCLPGFHKVGNCTSDPGSWTDGAFEISRTVTYQAETEANDDERGEVLFSADSLSIVCRTVQTPIGSMRDTDFRVLGTVKALRLQTGHEGNYGFVPAYTLVNEVLGGGPPPAAPSPVAVPVPARQPTTAARSSASSTAPSPAQASSGSAAATSAASSRATPRPTPSKSPSSKPAKSKAAPKRPLRR